MDGSHRAGKPVMIGLLDSDAPGSAIVFWASWPFASDPREDVLCKRLTERREASASGVLTPDKTPLPDMRRATQAQMAAPNKQFC